jgi:hypothetical protein
MMQDDSLVLFHTIAWDGLFCALRKLYVDADSSLSDEEKINLLRYFINIIGEFRTFEEIWTGGKPCGLRSPNSKKQSTKVLKWKSSESPKPKRA